MNVFLNRHHMAAALVFSLLVHAFALFGIVFTLPKPSNIANMLKPLQVVLVNSGSDSSPEHADAFANLNLDGGGNTKKDMQAQTPLPSMENGHQFTPEQSAMRVHELEQESRRLMAQLKSMQTVAQRKEQKKISHNRGGNDLVQHSLELARLQARIDKEYSNYQKMPRRTFIGARTREYRFAQYVEDWRIKVERVGNLNYPQAARQKKIFGSLQLTVGIRANGSVADIEVSRSSGKSLLDAAAVHIVRLSAPFPPLPPDIRRTTDILYITRTWTFTEANQLQSE